MTNFERITAEAKIVDKSDPNYNTDMDIIVPGTTKPYREMILAGFDPNNSVQAQRFLDQEMN
jgi:hypothetical protein